MRSPTADMDPMDKGGKRWRRAAARKRRAMRADMPSDNAETTALADGAARDRHAAERHWRKSEKIGPHLASAIEPSFTAATHSSGTNETHAHQAPVIAHVPNLSEATSASAGATPDFDLLSQNLARIVTQGTKALTAFLEPFETRQARNEMAEQVVDAVQSFGRVAEYWLGDPLRTIEAQKSLSSNFLSLWAHTLRRLSGEADQPIIPHDPSDKRYAAPQWRDSAVFDFLRQAHAITTNWANDLVARAETADPEVRAKAQFYLRQISSALSPSNFVATNPELLRETLASNAENLVRGTTFFAEDVAAGHGTLRISQSDSSQFELGVNMAATPGKVIFRNDLIELIQYAPATEQVFKRPLLIIPPWINKFYILDLNPQKSFVRFAVEQGLTVFLVSWVNPDARHRDMGFEAYIRQGIYAPLDVI